MNKISLCKIQGHIKIREKGNQECDDQRLPKHKEDSYKYSSDFHCCFSQMKVSYPKYWVRIPSLKESNIIMHTLQIATEIWEKLWIPSRQTGQNWETIHISSLKWPHHQALYLSNRPYAFFIKNKILLGHNLHTQTEEPFK